MRLSFAFFHPAPNLNTVSLRVAAVPYVKRGRRLCIVYELFRAGRRSRQKLAAEVNSEYQTNAPSATENPRKLPCTTGMIFAAGQPGLGTGSQPASAPSTAGRVMSPTNHNVGREPIRARGLGRKCAVTRAWRSRRSTRGQASHCTKPPLSPEPSAPRPRSQAPARS